MQPNRNDKKLKQRKTFWGFQVLDFKYRAKSKTWKSRKWTFFLLKPHCKVKVFSFRSFFWLWILYTIKNLSKIKLSEIFEFSILGIGQNRKLENLGNWYFSLIKPDPNVIVSFLELLFIYYQTLKKNRNCPKPNCQLQNL